MIEKPSPRRPAATLRRRSFLKALAVAPAYVSFPYIRAATPASGRGRTSRVDDEVKELRDPDTGARVMRLSGGESDNVHPYFTSDSFAGSSNRAVFASNRSGRFQYYLLEIRERRLTQLTDGEAVRPNLACVGGGRQLHYFDGPLLRSVELDTLRDRELYRVPDGWQPRLPSCTANGDYVCFAYGEKLEVSTQTSVIYSAMAETYFQRGSSVIMRIHADTGKPEAVWGERAWISHVLIHPTQPDTIVFCHEGGGLVKQRMWVVDAKQRLARQPAALYPLRPGEFTVHEYFTRNGDVGFQYEIERGGKMEYYNAFIRPDGTWIRQYLLPGRRPGHIQSNSDNTLIAGDRGYLNADDKDGANFMSLMTHGNGLAHLRRLCRYQPGPTQYSHGHPRFSPDDRWVIFNSRIGAKEHVAMADVTTLG